MVEQGPPRGRRQARVVVAHADPHAESPYETVLRWVAVSRGMPRPVLQARFDVRGRTYYADLCWSFEVRIDGRTVRIRIVCEYDGDLKYLGHATAADAARVLLAEKRREDDLRSMPHTIVLRFDRGDASRPDETFQRICAPLPASYVARLRVVPELVGLTAPRLRVL